RSAQAENDGERRPSLVVVPRSLVHNWIEEAARFAPQLRVLDYTGLERGARREEFGRFDLVVTTYGTLRRDAGVLKDMAFDYAILDESQAVKNAASQAAKACRLLSARHRLAMTGTPIENHLGELWSLFEFLNPGMLGRSSTLKQFAGARGKESGDLERLAKALRPFVLRRTKEQVLTELPEKTEQTLYCELDGKQRKLYDELRQHYRDLLNKKIASDGLQKSKIHVLEALLRLRQAACHPALIDKSNRNLPSAKLETLMEQLREVLEEGHKALVFSQFTSLLALVRAEFDRQGIRYEYLDGATRDRKQRVDRFQQDAACPVFLISLKAGGLGLNLTAADYVFILDPWWNPAVEAQAVDRAHRIGQTQRVFAYRLIARDTVEEKILQLQGDKRKLAEAIISADNSLISNLTADDLTLLLS
ncbi:MAG TPA: DEAD/DEAH box helicase, partial [Pirellulales bacterium]|nr:DEAD/DEAH box helicase [Pirellulales bacterium]